VVPVLGIAQIISWGSLYYPIAVLGGAIGRDLDIGAIAIFGSFTVGLFVSGIVAPVAGRTCRHAGRAPDVSCGSALGALALLVLALAHNTITLIAGFALAGLAMAGCLYDPAFATLHAISGTAYRKAVTALTLFGGFASTVFWPLSQFLLDAYGWRAVFRRVFSVESLRLPAAAPLDTAAGAGKRCARATQGEPTAVPRPAHPDIFFWLATALALAAFLSSALSAHVIGLLTSSGLTPRDAVLVSSLIGPMQVAGRVAGVRLQRPSAPAGRRDAGIRTVRSRARSCSHQVHGIWIVALAFALLYGWSNGVMTIVRGTVPGRALRPPPVRSAARPPRAAAIRREGIAPLALTLVFAIDPQRVLSLYALAAVGLLGFFAYRRALRASARDKD
jgi:MFS family permease